MALLSHFIKKVFSHNKGKSAKKHTAEPKVEQAAGNEDNNTSQTIVDGALITFVMEDVTMPFVAEIKHLVSLPFANRGLVKLEGRIESGTFGEVWKGAWKQGESETKVAVKFFVPKYDTARQERKILHHLQWKNCGGNDCVVKLIGSGSYAGKEFVVVEFIDGDCMDAICFTGDFQRDMEYTKEIFLNLALAIQSIHKRKVVHRDIKAENVIVCKHTRSVKLIDFGCSLLSYDKPFPAGTSPYVAPEVWKSIRTSSDDITTQECGGKDTEKSDIFSFGILLWTCLTGKLPFAEQSLESIKKQVLRGETPQMDVSWPEDMVDVMQACMKTNPAERLSATELAELLQSIRKTK